MHVGDDIMKAIYSVERARNATLTGIKILPIQI